MQKRPSILIVTETTLKLFCFKKVNMLDPRVPATAVLSLKSIFRRTRRLLFNSNHCHFCSAIMADITAKLSLIKLLEATQKPSSVSVFTALSALYQGSTLNLRCIFVYAKNSAPHYPHL